MERMTIYRTSDLYLSAFLKAKGMRLIDKQRVDRKYEFMFEDCPHRAKLINEFFNDGLVNISAFKSAIQDLKTIVFNT